MLIKLDENLSDAHTQFLKQKGYECDRVTDEGLSGATDEIVWQQVCQEGRFFITLDLDFADVRFHKKWRDSQIRGAMLQSLKPFQSKDFTILSTSKLIVIH